MAPSISDWASESYNIPMNFAHMYANIPNVIKAESVNVVKFFTTIFTYARQLICVCLDKITVDWWL